MTRKSGGCPNAVVEKGKEEKMPGYRKWFEAGIWILGGVP